MSEYQTIHEKIAVAGVYDQARFVPKKFRWQNVVHQVEKVTLTAEGRDGQVRLRWYGVISQGTLYRLSFNRDTEVWFLEEVWCE